VPVLVMRKTPGSSPISDADASTGVTLMCGGSMGGGTADVLKPALM